MQTQTQSSFGYFKGLLRRLAFVMAALCWFTTPVHAGTPFDGLVNLNTATSEELQLLPGVGPSKAKRILDHRARKPFRTVAELVRVKGFGTKTLARLRPFLTVNGPGTQAPAGRTIAAAGTPTAPCPCNCDDKQAAQKATGQAPTVRPLKQ